jgi:hypothetical protein
MQKSEPENRSFNTFQQNVQTKILYGVLIKRQPILYI